MLRSTRYAPDAFSAVAATSRSVIVTGDPSADNLIVYANPAFSALTGYSQSELIGKNCRILQGPDTDPLVIADIRRAIGAGTAIRREILNYRKDGTRFWNDLTIDPMYDEAGKLVGYIGIQSEADSLHYANDAKAEAEARLNSIAGYIPGYIYRRTMHSDGSIDLDYCSPSLGKLLGVVHPNLASVFYTFVHPADLDALLRAIRASAADMSLFREEFRLISADGATHWLRSDAPPRLMPNGDIVWDGLAIEFSAEKRWQSEIADLAFKEPLTGLMSRDAWRRAIALHLGTETTKPRQGGIIVADIAEFRALNAKLGQRICDELLKRVAERLTSVATPAAGIVARLSGDEFGILMPEIRDDADMANFAVAIAAVLERPIEVYAQLITVTVVLGASLCTEIIAPQGSVEEDQAGELMTQAELALTWAKQPGLAGYMLYSSARDDRYRNQTVLARSLEQAIGNDELELHYQPLVDIASGRIVSAEALVRWNHPTLGMQRPDLFIPLAEKSGMILQLGRWVIDRAIRQRAMWALAQLSPPPIAINVSGVQLIDPRFVSFVAESLRSTQSNAKDFEIELTEGQLVEASPEIMASLHALRDMGFAIAIDDFGSGHATFRYLRDFPIDKLKIDQMFVRKLVAGSGDALIIRAIISLAREMGIRVVAEGVEAEMQREFLQREGCEIAQGYLFSLPLVAEDFGWLLASGLTLPLAAPQTIHSDNVIKPGLHRGTTSP